MSALFMSKISSLQNDKKKNEDLEKLSNDLEDILTIRKYFPFSPKLKSCKLPLNWTHLISVKNQKSDHKLDTNRDWKTRCSVPAEEVKFFVMFASYLTRASSVGHTSPDFASGGNSPLVDIR